MQPEKRFPVVEVFGPTIQGEGVLAGVPTHFVRLGGCDYACSWCDSAPAVLPEFVRKAEKLSADEIFERLVALEGTPRWVTISGGNPVLHDMTDLVTYIHSNGISKVAVETQGTLFKDWLLKVDVLTVSPKPPSSGNMTTFDTTRTFLSQAGLRPGTVLKCVVFDELDYAYARDVHLAFPGVPFYLSVGTFMGGLQGDFTNAGRGTGGIQNQWGGSYGPPIDDNDSILIRYRWLIEKMVKDPAMGDVTVYPQLHALVWGHERGH